MTGRRSPSRQADRTPSVSVGAGARTPRWHALDALRVVALLPVIVSHGSLAYVRHEVPCLLWAVRDRSTHVVFDVLFHWTRVAVPLFFALGGFFAAVIYQAKGRSGFLKDRACRILVPLLAEIPTVLPLSLWVWAYGWSRSGRCSDLQLLRLMFLDPEIRANRYGPGHLWFLENLCIYLAGYVLFRTAADRRGGAASGAPRGGRGESRLLSPVMPVLLAVPTALLLWASHEPNGLDAVLNRRNRFVPDPYGLVFYGLFFAFGVALHRARFGLCRLRRGCWALLAASLLTFALRFLILDRDIGGRLPPSWVPLGALLGSLTCWLSVYALLGLAVTCVRGESRAIRYQADASYWVYWCHFPVVGLVQIHLARAEVPLALKFAAVVVVTLGWTLASYQVLVRHTALGRWLHGPRDRGRPRPAPTEPAAPSPRLVEVSIRGSRVHGPARSAGVASPSPVHAGPAVRPPGQGPHQRPWAAAALGRGGATPDPKASSSGGSTAE